MDRLDIPEKAIQAFEETHHLRVTIHDLAETLSAAILKDRFQHRHTLCRCVKENAGEVNCVDLEISQLRLQLDRFPEGRFHVCHAGFVEWVVPVFHQYEVEWVIFAGIRMPGPGLQPAFRQRLSRWERIPWSGKSEMPPPVEEKEAQRILENLRQLCVRLYVWAHQKDWIFSSSKEKIDSGNSLLIQRRILIRRYIEAHHSTSIRLKDLARELEVSEDRASHLIHECCGQTFREILIDVRLKMAKELLRFSSLPVLEVALASGFTEITHFHRLFHRRVGLTPRQYRQT